MEWKLDDNRPIWMQLQEQLTRKILSGWYHSGEKLPSVRELASEAGVNPNTMQRALAGLDMEGLTVTNRTMGRTVTEDRTVIEGMRATLAKDIIRQFYQSASELGYTKEQAMELLMRRED
ncbi:MAG: GntR family transcriptional regulator [Lachnospiraceae bacterium]